MIIITNNNDLEVAHAHSGSSSTWFLVELEFENAGVLGKGKTGVPGEKPLEARERTNNKLNPNLALSPGFEPGPHWWEAKALTTAPPLLPNDNWLQLQEFVSFSLPHLNLSTSLRFETQPSFALENNKLKDSGRTVAIKWRHRARLFFY